MSKSSNSKAPDYPSLTMANTGLFGSSITTPFGTSFTPTKFQKQLVNVSKENAIPYLQSYLNPDYESEDFKRGDEYYTNKMKGILENNYLNDALNRNLLRGSTAADIYRGFANDLATTEYERQNDYRDQQLQNYMAAMMPYTTVYDMSTGTMGLSQALANSIADYNLGKYKAEKSSSGSNVGSQIGSLLGGAGSFAQGMSSLKGGGTTT